MKILLIINFLLLLIFFWYLMLKLDNFLDKNSISIRDKSNSANAIVLGTTDLANSTVKLLGEKGLAVIHLIDPFQLIQERKLCYLFALSGNDADNIAFYKIGKKLYCIENQISICNDMRNESMFISENISYLLYEKATTDKLLQRVQRQMEVDFGSDYK